MKEITQQQEVLIGLVKEKLDVLRSTLAKSGHPVVPSQIETPLGKVVKALYEWLSTMPGVSIPTELEAAIEAALIDSAREQMRTTELLLETSLQKAAPTKLGIEQNTAPSLAFPYATKELEAMHAAACKHWAQYTPDKRQPTQKEVGYDLCELLGLPVQSTGEPARKAMILATAIRPDTLPSV